MTLNASELPDAADFALYFPKSAEVPRPASMFAAISVVVDALQEIDRLLIVSVGLEPSDSELQLLELESGSIRLFFRNLLATTDDANIAELDWKKLLGSQLVRLKYWLLERLESTKELEGKEDVLHLEQSIRELVAPIERNLLPGSAVVPTSDLLKQYARISDATKTLEPNNRPVFVSRPGSVALSGSRRLDNKTIERIVVAETRSENLTAKLVVKKPDYLGDSMWEFKLGDGNISARIADLDWLNAFRERNIDLRPGDAIDAELNITTRYDHLKRVVTERCEVFLVHRVVRAPVKTQLSLLPE